MSTLTQALVINAAVLFAVLEADCGPHRKIGFFRIARPLLMAGSIVPLFLDAPATHGTGLALEIAGVAAGLLLGMLGLRLMTVYLSPRTGKPVSRSGWGYAALWITIVGARSAFSYGSEHWFADSLGRWMVQHQVGVAAVTDTLILMAVAMVLTRTIGLAGRSMAVRAQGSRQVGEPVLAA